MVANASNIKNSLTDLIYTEEIESRIAIEIANEDAKKESARRRINAPLSIEEEILHKNDLI